jgi:hypothetical protein
MTTPALRTRASRPLSRRTVGALAALVVSASALTGLGSDGADAASCAPATNVLRGKAKVTRLPGRATMRVWTTRNKSMRLVAVTIPASSSLDAKVYSSGSLTRHRSMKALASGHRKAVVVINGSVFQTTGHGVPSEQFAAPGLRKLSRSMSSSLAVTRDGRARLAMVSLSGRVTTPSGRLALNGVNLERPAATGVTVYTPAWGQGRHPKGTAEIIVRGGRVIDVRSAVERGLRVPSASVALTGTGRAAKKLNRLRRGARVKVGYSARPKWQKAASAPKNLAAPMVAAVDLGKRVLRHGAVVSGGCDARDERRRPRTAVGWKRDGTLIVLAVSGRPSTRGGAVGGATNAQVGMYLKQLGAVDGSKLDGGSSTTLYVRTRVGRPLVRMDRPQGAIVPSVANAVGFEVP